MNVNPTDVAKKASPLCGGRHAGLARCTYNENKPPGEICPTVSRSDKCTKAQQGL